MQNLKQILKSLKTLLLKTSSYILVFVILALVVTSSIITIFSDTEDSKDYTSCNTLVIKINGELVQYKSDTPENWTDETVVYDVLTSIERAEKDETIKAIILRINSGGGSPAGAQTIANALKRSSKPTIALVERSADSAAYWLATGASKIFASNLSEVGDIGIINEMVEQTGKDKQDGYTYNVLTSSKYKGLGNVHVPLTESDKEILMKDINTMHDIFVNEVATNRKLDKSVVAKLADGSVFLGDEALKNGLIDKIGDMFTVNIYLSEQIREEVVTCE